ncbi:methyltransferase [Terrabacter ginsenosidimutans]|jgi:hypothetical protein|uniref:Methyltransferase n=1 Tax=Terrabacter ginsenosidimutans TaxID=490575 RepID=A0ABP7CPT0_9MICO
MDVWPDLGSLITGFRTSAAISVAAELGISDELAAGPLSLAELAARVGADEDTLGRLMRVLTELGLYAVSPEGACAATPLGAELRSDVAGSLRPLARTLQDPATWAAWGHLLHSVRTGETAFEALHGVDVWNYRADHPQAGDVFNDNMTALTSRVAAAVARAYDFDGLRSVVDVGGGHGVLLEAVLTRHAHLQGAVFDLPQGIPDGPPASASESVASRWSVVPGSFFESVPPADAYLLKKVLHDWSDEKCVEILSTCRRSLEPGGVVLVVELVLDRPGHELEAALSDLNMLVLPGGRERTVAQFDELFTAAGFEPARVVDTDADVVILEAHAAR